MSQTEPRRQQPDAEQLLEERARALARVDEQTERKLWARVIAFQVGDQTFGLPADRVREVLPSRPVRRLPGLPAWLTGIVQVRGELLSVISLSAWFDTGRAGRPKYLLVLEHAGRSLGLHVDALLGIRELYDDELAATSQQRLVERDRPVQALTRELWLVLDPSRLMEQADLRAARRGPAGEGGPQPAPEEENDK